ncbi:MAG: stage II sporulation protein D [Solibacillus sp.]
MKKILLSILLLSLFVIPLFMLKKLPNSSKQMEEPVENMCQLFISINNTSIPIEDYLIGVLAGEMPASFHEEALKAQAIAARTYVLKQTNNGQTAISATTAHQVFNDQQMREEKWQAAFAQNEQKLEQAVNETKQQVLTYQDQLITAMFHASSYKQTESAQNYSDNALPYLQSVPTSELLEPQQLIFSYNELNTQLQQNFTAKEYQQAKIQKNSSERIESVTIAGKTWSGREIREYLNLRSTHFIWEQAAAGIQITTLGYGHGVGMSQEGANAMAQRGATAEDILAHYYPNTNLQTFDYCEK